MISGQACARVVVDVRWGARGAAGGRMHLPLALRGVDLPQSVREELHGGVEESTPPSRHVGVRTTTLSAFRVAKPAGGLRRRPAGVIAVEVPIT